MRRERGFTFFELIMVLAVTAVLAALVAPNFIEQFARRRIEGVATELSTDLHFTRSQAVSERATVSLVTENGGTQYRVFNAAGTIKTVPLPGGITLTDGVTVAYDPMRGMLTGAAQQIDLANTRTTATVRLNVNAMGRVNLCSPSGSLKGYTPC